MIYHVRRFSRMSSVKRELIWVTNNKDFGWGSLTHALERGHLSASQGKAIEIAFKGNFSIKPMQKTSLHKYTINGGDWLINNRATKNITIDGSNQKSLDRVRSLFRINSPENMDGALYGNKPTRVDITRINLVNNEVKGGAISSGGGSLAAGAAVLHWGGHLTWKDSVIQSNKVSGGIGKSGAAGGNGWYRHGYKNSSIKTSYETWGFRGAKAAGKEYSKQHPVGINSWLNHFFHQGGEPGAVYAGETYGGQGGDGQSGRSIGEGGQGGGGGGGGGVSDKNQYYERSNPNVWGNGGKGGNGGNGAYGAGGGAGGGGGGNAGTDSASGPFWSTSRTPDWSPAQPGRGGKGGEWATDGTSGAKPSRQKGGSGGKGGDGAALGTFTSFASDTQDSSLTLDNVDFIDNEAKGGDGTGRFRAIFSRDIEVKHNELTLSSGSSSRGNAINENSSFKSDHTEVNKTKVHDAFGKFKKIDKAYAPAIIHSASYELKTDAEIDGKVFKLNPNVDNVISLKAYNESKYTHDIEIKGSKNLLKALNIINDSVHQTKSEAEIKQSHKGVFNSFTSTMVANSAKDFVVEKASDTITDYVSETFKGKALKNVLFLGGALGVGALVAEGIYNQLKEDARIEKELEIKKKIDETRENVKTLIPDELTIEPIPILHKRTNDVFLDFVIGQDQIIFDAGIRPTLKYRGDGRIDIEMDQESRTVTDNKAPLIGEIRLNQDQHSVIAGTTWNKNDYFDSLLHVRQFGDEKRYILAKDTKWNYLRGNADAQSITTSIANDRLIIQRDLEGGVGNDKQLQVHTHQGNDRILGDQGSSQIEGGRGDDFISPDLGIDEVFGGPGFDTVDYSNLAHSITVSTNKDGNLEAIINNESKALLSKDTLHYHKIKDKLYSGVESIRSKGGSNIDLSHAIQPTEGVAVNEASYLIATGSGSEIKGSNFDDIFMISYDSEFNIDPAGSIKQNNSVTKLNGNDGNNTLLIDGLFNHMLKGNNFELVVRWNPSEGDFHESNRWTEKWGNGKQKCNGVLYNVTDGGRHEILTFENLTTRPIFTDFNDQYSWMINGFQGWATREIGKFDVRRNASNKRVFATNTITDEDLVDDKFKKIINQKWSIDDDLIDSDDIDWGHLDKISGIEEEKLDYYKNLRFVEKLSPNIVSALSPELKKGISSKVTSLDDEFETGSNEEWRAINDFMVSEDTDQKYFNLIEKLNPKAASILLPELAGYI